MLRGGDMPRDVYWLHGSVMRLANRQHESVDARYVLMDLGGVMEHENACVAAAGWRDDNRLGAPEVCCALMDLGGVMERENACVESGLRDDKRPELTADAR